MNIFEKHHNRRDLLRAIGRIFAFGCLAGTGLFLTKRKSLSQQEDACGVLNPCTECAALNKCGLPQALAARQPGKEKQRG